MLEPKIAKRRAKPVCSGEETARSTLAACNVLGVILSLVIEELRMNNAWRAAIVPSLDDEKGIEGAPLVLLQAHIGQSAQHAQALYW